jgi:hypothetical protein
VNKIRKEGSTGRCSTHHHQPGPSLFQLLGPVIVGTKVIVPLVNSAVGMAFAVVASSDLVVIVAQHNATRAATETPRMELQALIRLEVLALNTAIARAAERAVELVVVLLAVGSVVEHVKLRGGEGRAASAANEALLVVAACETPRGVFD